MVKNMAEPIQNQAADNGSESIRDVIPFPKTTSGQCLMSGAPSPVTDPQLDELHLKRK